MCARVRTISSMDSEMFLKRIELSKDFLATANWTNLNYYTIGYTKIGDTVHIQGYVQVSGGSPSGNLEMSLPFVVDNSGAGHSRYSAIVVSMRGHGGTASLPDVVFAPQPNSSKGEFISVAANGTHTWINNTHINTTWNLRIGGTYKTSA